MDHLLARKMREKHKESMIRVSLPDHILGKRRPVLIKIGSTDEPGRFLLTGRNEIETRVAVSKSFATPAFPYPSRPARVCAASVIRQIRRHSPRKTGKKMAARGRHSSYDCSEVSCCPNYRHRQRPRSHQWQQQQGPPRQSQERPAACSPSWPA